jgi:hypothetical protein
MAKFLRTCSKCGKNLYSPGEYKTHMAADHNKDVQVKEPRTVNHRKSAEIDVPDEVLVKSKRKKTAEKKESKPATKRRGRQKAEDAE